MTRSRSHLLIVIAILTSLLPAQTTWTGAASTNWSLVANWSAGVPTAAVDAIIPAGTPNNPSTAGVAGAVCRDLTINSGATLSIAPSFPVAAGRNITVSGSIAGGGMLRSVANLAANLSGAGSIGADIEVAKTGTTQVLLNGNVTVTGNLILTSGTLRLSNSPNETLAVTGNAAMQGGVLNIFNAGILDVAGNVTFSGTSVTGTMPTIRCAANFTADAGFAPTAGLVVMDGTGAQAISGTFSFPDLTIATGSSTTATSVTTVSGRDATVNGALAITGALDANGAVVVNPGGALDLGGGIDTVAGNLTVGGTMTATGTVVFDGSSSTTFSVSSLPNVEVAKTGAAQLTLNSNVSVNGNLTLTSGALRLSNSSGQTMSVAGNAFMQGGVFTIFNAGILDVAGNVTFSGASVTGTIPTIRCAGNFTADASFAPATGLIVMDRVGSQTISGTFSFPDLTIAPGSVTTAASVATVPARVLTVDGALAVSGVLDANGNVAVNAGGVLDLGGGTDTMAGDLTAAGTVTATGTVVFDGSTGATFSVSSLPSVQVAKTGAAQLTLNGNVTVNGDLSLTSGTLRLSNSPGQTMSVTGNAFMQGGVLNIFNAGILDVAGNVTFSGTSVTTTVPTIRCAGNFTADASFAPPSGLVVMDKFGSQTISGAFSFPDLTIAAGSVTTAVSVTTVSTRVLTVNGSLAVSGALDANGNVFVNAGAALDVGGGTDTIAGSLTGGGTVTGTGVVVLDGASGADLSVPAVPSLQVAKSAGTELMLTGNVTVNGNLSMTSGTLRLSSSPGQTMTVTGNASMQGGVLNIFNAGILDVAGNVTFSGTSVTTTVPTIRCAGNFTADAGFAPTAGTVELDGASPTTIAHASTGGTMMFANLALKNGARSPANDFTIAAVAITIDPGATLAVPTGRHLSVHRSGTTALNVNGALSVAPNGTLSMGPQTTATVNGSGSLSLVGTPGQPATVDGASGGGYTLLVFGTIAARHFVVKEMGPAGMFVNTDATIAAAPNDIRNGTFDHRTNAPAGSVLLDIRRIVPTSSFDALVFLNTAGAAGVFNVTTIAGGMPISFTNWSGALGGPSFENDLHGLITWNLQAGPPLSAFAVIPGAERASVVWTTGSEANVTGYQLFRAPSAAGPFFLRTSQAALTGVYGFVDAPLAPNQPVFYALYASMSQAELVFLASGATTPYSAAVPGNVKKVGGNGAFTTIQAAINAATDPNSVVWVTPGNYDSFTIGAMALPSNLRILGDGTGPVNISTANGPVQITNVPAAFGVELSNLTIGSATSAQNGIVVTACVGPVVLDELSVSCDATHAAISVSSSPATAIQRSNIAGGTGLSVTNGSYVAISRGSLSSLLATGSTVEMATLTPGSVSVSPPASLITRTGLMPDIDLPEFLSLSIPSALSIEAQPNAPFVIAASPRLGFQTSSSWEMPFLLDPMALAQLPTMLTDPLGLATVEFTVSPIPLLLGFSFTVQVVVIDPTSGMLRFSNVESMVCIP